MSIKQQIDFVLLKDFEHAYDYFALKVIGVSEQLEREVLQPMEQSLSEVVTSFKSFVLQSLRDEIRHRLDDRYFIVTLDGGTYFSDADFSIEITRACLSLYQSATGPHFRLPRDLAPQLIQQALRLRHIYEQQGNGRPIALCDDGIGTGDSLGKIISLLEQIGLSVNQIFVLINPRALSAVRNIDVETFLPFDAPHIWLSERDLIWGLPRSGLSYTTSDELRPSAGIPYTISDEMVAARIGLKGEAGHSFRQTCLKLNIQFWKILERHHGRPLLLTDCSRLEFLSSAVKTPVRVVEFIEHIISDPDFIREDFSNAPRNEIEGL